MRRLFLIALTTALTLVLSSLVPLTGLPSASAARATQIQRMVGTDSVGVAAQAAKTYPAGQPVVLVVAVDAHADSMVAATRAGGLSAPVVFVKRDSIPSATAEALRHLSPERLLVIGGTDVVSTTVEQQLGAYSRGRTERVQGANRYQTAAALSGHHRPGIDRLYIAGGEGFADAIAGAAVAGHENMPMLLTRVKQLDRATASEIRRLKPREIVVLGGPEVVSAAVERALAGLVPGKPVQRVAGSDRFATAAQLSGRMPARSAGVHVANGSDYSQALVAAALAARDSQPLLLTKSDRVPASTLSVIKRIKPGTISAVGTSASISDQVVEQLEGAGSGAPASASGNPCKGVPSTDTTFGASLDGTLKRADALADADASFGRVPIVRDFNPGMPPAWDSSRAKLLSDRQVILSFKVPPTEVVSGKHDAFFRNWFATAPDDQTIYWSYFHEPEVKVKNGLFTPQQYRAAWTHLDKLADKACKPNMFPTLILTSWTIDPRSGRDYRDYDAGKDVIEVIAFDPYNALHDPDATTYRDADKFLGGLAETMEADGRPWGLAELGSRVVVGDDGRRRGAWLTSLGSFLVEHDALFATYFNTTYNGVKMKLDDPPSRTAWASLVQR